MCIHMSVMRQRKCGNVENVENVENVGFSVGKCWLLCWGMNGVINVEMVGLVLDNLQVTL